MCFELQTTSGRLAEETCSFVLVARTNCAKFFGISERGRRVLSEQESRDLHEAGRLLCSRYVALSKEALRHKHW